MNNVVQAQSTPPPPPPIDMLGPGPIERVRIDLTTNCNLRCVYCIVSQLDYVGQDMAPSLIERTKKIVLQLATHNDLAPIEMNGHGETTLLPGWVEACRTLLARKIPLRMTSNFSKDFDDTEINTLARMSSIAISIDSHDRALLRRMRRKVDVRLIATNIHRVRMAAQALYIDPPAFRFLAGLYDQNALLVEDFARFAISLGVAGVEFWHLKAYLYANTDVDVADQVKKH